MGIDDQKAKDMMFGFGEDDDLDDDLDDDQDDFDDDDNDDEPENDVDIDSDEELQTLRKQSPKLDSAFAKLRKQAEQQEARVKELDSYFAQKYKDDFNINNSQDFLSYMRKQDEDSILEAYNTKKEELESKGVDPSEIDEMIRNHPEFKATREKLERMEQNSIIKDQLAELTSKDKRIQDIEDINKILPKEKQLQFWELHKKNGLTLSQAYILTNETEMMESNRKAGKQSALNSFNSKSHMKTSRGGADIGFDEDMSEEEYKAWRGIMPGWSDKQIKEYRKKNA